MYVCICNGYRDTEICQVARSGVRCARTAYLSLGHGPRCGRCLTLAQDLIDQVHEGSRTVGSVPAAPVQATMLPHAG
jgi:bacterioferritin-associated ferredoxin